MSVRRSSVGVAALGDYIYAIGGFDGNCKQSLDTVEIFDIRLNQWIPGPTMNLKRFLSYDEYIPHYISFSICY